MCKCQFKKLDSSLSDKSFSFHCKKGPKQGVLFFTRVETTINFGLGNNKNENILAQQKSKLGYRINIIISNKIISNSITKLKNNFLARCWKKSDFSLEPVPPGSGILNQVHSWSPWSHWPSFSLWRMHYPQFALEWIGILSPGILLRLEIKLNAHNIKSLCVNFLNIQVRLIKFTIVCFFL